MFVIVESSVTAAAQLQSDVDKISHWANQWLVKFNPSKSESLVISRKRNQVLHPTVYMFNTSIPSVDSHKHLGVFLSNDGSWHQQINYIKDKAWSRVNVMKRLRYRLDRKSLEVVYISFIRPILEYACVIWDNCTQYEKDELDKIQNEAARVVTGCTRLVSLRQLQIECGWESLSSRRHKQKLILFFKMKHGQTPDYLSDMIPQTVGQLSARTLRNSSNITNIRSRTSLYEGCMISSRTVVKFSVFFIKILQNFQEIMFHLYLKQNHQLEVAITYT